MGRAMDGAISTILVPLQGTATDAEVLRLACHLARERGARLRALYVIQVPRSRELGNCDEAEEERGRAVLAMAREMAQQSGCTLQTGLMTARDAGRAIVDESVEWAADMVVLAMPFQSRSGDAALHVLEKGMCAVVVFRPPRPAQNSRATAGA